MPDLNDIRGRRLVFDRLCNDVYSYLSLLQRIGIHEPIINMESGPELEKDIDRIREEGKRLRIKMAKLEFPDGCENHHPILFHKCSGNMGGPCVGCQNCKECEHCRICGGFSERYSWIAYRKEKEGYRPEHTFRSLGGYCDACNLPGCLLASILLKGGPLDGERMVWGTERECSVEVDGKKYLYRGLKGMFPEGDRVYQFVSPEEPTSNPFYDQRPIDVNSPLN